MGRTTSARIVLAVALAAWGCGGTEDAASPPEPSAPPEGPAETAEVAPPPAEATAPTPPEAPASPTPPAAPPSLAARIAALPAVVPAPTAQTAGPLTITATVCTMDGPPIVGSDSFRSIGPPAWASDGSLWILDDAARVRRYVVAPGAGCALTMDTSLGDGGTLALGEGIGRAPESVVADGNGHVFVSSSMHGTDRLTGTRVDYHCEETRGRVTVAPSGAVGLALFGSGPIRRVHFGDAGCTVEDWGTLETFAAVSSVSFLDEDHLLVGGHGNESWSAHRARVWRADGSPDGAPFGDTSGTLSADDHFCHVHGATRCGDHLCILDGNCRALRIFDHDHAVVGAVDLARLVGLRYPWIPGMTAVRDGSAYLTAIQQRDGRGTVPPPASDGDRAVGVYDGFVVRVCGF